MGCVPCGASSSRTPEFFTQAAEGSPVARWQVAYPNGQVVLYLNEEQAKKDAARRGVTATPYIPPGFPDA